MSPVTPMYRCHCGAVRSEFPSQSPHDVCERCGTTYTAQHVGSAVAAQPSPGLRAAKAAAIAAPLAAAVKVPVGNPGHPVVVRSLVSNGKVSSARIDAVTGRIINDTRQG